MMYRFITNEQLATEIRDSGTWDNEMISELCDRAGLGEEYANADGENFEEVVYKAAEILRVEID